MTLPFIESSIMNNALLLSMIERMYRILLLLLTIASPLSELHEVMDHPIEYDQSAVVKPNDIFIILKDVQNPEQPSRNWLIIF